MMKSQFNKGAARNTRPDINQFDERASMRKMLDLCKLFGKDTESCAKATHFVKTLFDPSTPTYKFSLRIDGEYLDVSYDPASRYLLNTIAFGKIITETREVLKSRGYLEPVIIWTGQEHKIIGSSPGKAGEDVDPYVPIANFKHIRPLEEVIRARELSLVIPKVDIMLASFTYIIHGKLSGNPAHIAISLEPLDKDGKTIRDPRAIDLGRLDAALRDGARPSEALDFADMKLEKRKDFPYARAD